MTSSTPQRAQSPCADVSCYCAPTLDERMRAQWQEFNLGVPWAHFRQDPSWAPVESDSRPRGPRRAYYFWAERSGHVCLTGVGVRRHLPVPNRVFLEFPNGPTFGDLEALDAWLSWIAATFGDEVARLRVAPAAPLDEWGDDIETLLERHGFTRRRVLGGWATLVIDISPSEDEILSGFRPATRRSLRKSQSLGIEVRVEDSPQGWSALASLQADLADRAPIRAADAEKIGEISSQWLRDGSGGTVLVARQKGEPLAAALLVVHRGTAHLPLIPSSKRYRKVPASHLLVWEAMLWAKRHGCTALDMSGYSLVAEPGDSLWGINQFKRGFASIDRVAKFVAIHEKVSSPIVATAATAARRTQSWWQTRQTRAGD